MSQDSEKLASSENYRRRSISSRYETDMGSFWLRDKLRVIAELFNYLQKGMGGLKSIYGPDDPGCRMSLDKIKRLPRIGAQLTVRITVANCHGLSSNLNQGDHP
ncbi:MAG: hypothetical protein ACLP7A_01960 [Desulfobaccales bacterium]